MDIKHILIWIIIASLGVSGILYDVSSKKAFVTSNQLLTFANVKAAFEQEGLHLENWQGKAYFKLNGVYPRMFKADDGEFVVYVFNSEDNRQKGWDDFHKQTETMMLEYSHIYEVRNVLIFELRKPNNGYNVQKVIDRLYGGTDFLRNMKIEGIASANLIPSHAGCCAFSLLLRKEDSKENEVITKILGWLHSATIIGEAKNGFVSLGSNPTTLGIMLQNGTSITLEDAFDSVLSKLDNGSTLVQSMTVENQITLVQSGTKAMRLKSPELKEWIEKGWSQEDVFRFTQTDALAKVLTKQAKFPASPDQVKTIYEDVGGKQGSKIEVLLTTKVEELGGREFIVTLTKNYQLTVGGKSVVTYWKYHVNPSEVVLIDSKDEMPMIK
ncbi:hypothetical protein [Paenibacillus sp. N3.4]|uniref:hypothetical protein n=1 Tax=Paenibacillus sp. N3.4 TaxID=2603222 RepID=UPI0011C94478|nr:hypothetical protein [Paenibacillus sp. N3.4]TXK85587.1 hypothetical protein FU659_03285 [Paenibacillus sp. N3.4]